MIPKIIKINLKLNNLGKRILQDKSEPKILENSRHGNIETVNENHVSCLLYSSLRNCQSVLKYVLSYHFCLYFHENKNLKI